MNDIDESLRRKFSRQELADFAREFMLQHEGAPKDLPPDQRERWYVKLGLLTQFCCELWEKN